MFFQFRSEHLLLLYLYALLRRAAPSTHQCIFTSDWSLAGWGPTRYHTIIADASAASHVNDHRAPPAPDALNEVDVIRELERVEGEIAIHEEELEILNRLRELRRRRGAEDYSGFHKIGFGS